VKAMISRAREGIRRRILSKLNTLLSKLIIGQRMSIGK